LDEAIKKLETDLKKARKKEADGEDTIVRSSACNASSPTHLVYRKNLRSRWWICLMQMFVLSFLRLHYSSTFPPFQLDEEGLKEKKKQKLLKAGFEARARARREKEREREEKEREEKKEEEEREMDLIGWSKKLKQEQEVGISLCSFYCRFSNFAIDVDDQDQGTSPTKGCAGRSQKCCCAGKNEKHRESGSRRSCAKEKEKGWWW
jgi:hypothetical protein